MKARAVVAVLGLLAAAAAGPAAAQEKGLYLGGSIGYGQYRDSCDDTLIAGTCDDNDTVWRAFAGYQFNRNFGLELGYADLGEVRAQGDFFGLPASFRAKVTAFDLSGILSYPIANRLTIFGRLGAYLGRTTVDSNLATLSEQDGETNSGFTYGLGLGFELGFVGLRLEWHRYDNVGGGSTGEDTVDIFGLAALIRF